MFLFSVCCLVFVIYGVLFGCCVKLVNFVAQIGLKADVSIYGDKTKVKARYAKDIFVLE